MARKIRLTVLTGLLLAALLALLLPIILKSEAMRLELADRLSYHLTSEIALDRIEWSWLPTPHLLVQGVDVKRPDFQLMLPEIHVFPSFTALLQLRLEPRRVQLTEPSLQLDPTSLLAEEPSPPPLFPRTFAGRVEITRGAVHVLAAEIPAKNGREAWRFEAMDFTELEAAIQLSPLRLDLELALQPSFGEHLALRGHYEADGTYQLQAKGRELRLHEVLSTPIRGIIPLEATANLDLTATGTGLETVDATLTGELPCFLLPPGALVPHNDAVRLDCGVIDLALSRRADYWQVMIHDFELKEPELRFSGAITRNGREAESPHWDVELQGRELNVDKIMPTVLKLFGEHRATQKVAEIVLGGQVSRASFRLAGEENELRNPWDLFDRMVLEVEVEQAEIMVPQIDLYLPEASGLVLIANSTLELRRGQARRGRSRGYDGSLRVGLRNDRPILELDLELDADLEDLHALLPGMIPHPVFQREMARFPRAEGEASGRLVISDSWRDFTVDVTIRQGHGEIMYDRLPWPLAVQRGRILIDQDEVRWHELEATAGPHQLTGSTGRVALTAAAPFSLEETGAILDSGTIFAHLRSYPVLEKALKPVLREIDGRLTVVAGEAAGELFRPKEWQYAATIGLAEDKLSWYSPLLATEVQARRGSLRFDQEQVDLRQLEVDLQDSSFNLEGRLQHQLLQNWQGKVELSGLLTPDNRLWLQGRQWLPEIIIPRAPVTIAPLAINWDENFFELAGTLLPRMASVTEQPRLEFTARREAGQALAINSRILDGARQARLDLNLPRGYQGLTALFNPAGPVADQRLPSLAGEFSGELRGGVLGHFFAFFAHQLQPGSWQGAAAFQMPAAFVAAQDRDHAADFMAPAFSGHLEVRGLSWFFDPDHQQRITIKDLSLSGQEQSWQLQQLELELNPAERLVLAGAINASASGFELELELFSPYLQQQTLTSWLEVLKKRSPYFEIVSEPRSWPVTGRLDFQLAEFDSAPWRPDPEAAALRWQPLAGSLSLTPATGLVAEIRSAGLCYLELDGTWYLDPELGDSSFTIRPAGPETPRFEKMLPCLGIEQDIISGDSQLTVELQGDFDHWRRGRVSVVSPEGGRIMRMGLLSRIFSLINLTDIFTSGIAGLDEQGFAYRELEFEALIKDHVLVIEKALVRGDGLNLLARGSLELADYQADMVVLVAPFKTIDTLVSWIPFIGRIIGGEDATVVTIPVGVKGDIRNPQLTVMAPDAVGEGLLNLLRSTLMLPFNILSPILPSPPAPEEGGNDNSD